jgi:hypothetical protein
MLVKIPNSEQFLGFTDRDALGTYKRQLAALAQVYSCICNQQKKTGEILGLSIDPKLVGFAGFQAPAYFLLAEAHYICRGFSDTIAFLIEKAKESAHNIQDAQFCAKTTSRCNAMQHRWWKLPASELLFSIGNISKTVDRLCKNPASSEFAAIHKVGEDYSLRTSGPNKLPLPDWRQANTLETIAQIYQKSVVELQRFNSEQDWAIDAPLPSGTWVNIPDPGFVNLLTGRLSAEILVDCGLSDGERVRLIQALVPLASANPTVLDTVLSRLLLAARPTDASILDALDTTAKRYLS